MKCNKLIMCQFCWTQHEPNNCILNDTIEFDYDEQDDELNDQQLKKYLDSLENDV